VIAWVPLAGGPPNPLRLFVSQTPSYLLWISTFYVGVLFRFQKHSIFDF